MGAFASTVTSAAAGASAGASVGSVIPIVGTAVGAIIGAVGGVVNAALHRVDPEQADFDKAVAMWQVNPASVYNIANKYLPLAGLFDLSLKNPHIPIYQKYGRMGEKRFVTDLVSQVYQAAQAGQITANDTALTIMSRIVQPWIDSWGFGPMQDPHADLINRLIVGMINDYIAGVQRNWTAVGGDYPFGSLPVFSLPSATAAVSTPTTTANPVGSSNTAQSAVLSSDGSIIVPGSGTGLKNTFGVWSFGTTVNPNGVDIQLLLNGSASGFAIKALLANGGSIYALNSLGGWYVYKSDGWNQTTNPTISSSVTPLPPPLSVTPVGTGTIPQVTTASPSPTVGTTNTGATVTQADLQALIGQLASQGQSAQQAYTSALQALQANGVQPTAAVQSAVQQAVQTTPAPASATSTTAGLSGLGWLGVITAGTLLLATARPFGKTTRRKRHR